MSNDYPDHLYYNNTYFFGPYLHHGRVDPKFIKDLLAIGEKSQDMIDMKKYLAGDLNGINQNIYMQVILVGLSIYRIHQD